jgi:hypothetical protein
MRQKARIIAKLGAKYRASAFFVNELGRKTADFTFHVNEGYPEYRPVRCKMNFVNKPYRGVNPAPVKVWDVVASL